MATLIQKQLVYAVVSQLTDDDDFSKNIIVSSHATFPLTLWNNEARAANDITTPFDVSKYGSIGFYFETNAATTISIQVATLHSIDGSGWSTYDTVAFTGAGSQFYSIWLLPFQSVRFMTSAGATLTIQAFLRT